MGANAQTSVFTFTAGQVLTAAQLNATARTGVPVFATTTDRDAAFGGTGEKTLAEGQVCYIEAAPKRLQVYDGSAWLDYDTAYQAFTPTFTNLTVGNGTVDFEYARFGKFVHYLGRFQMGTTSSVTGTITINTPTTQDGSVDGVVIQSCTITDNGLTDFTGGCYCVSPTSVFIGAILASGTYTSWAGSSATVPMTWGNLDRFMFNIVYKTA